MSVKFSIQKKVQNILFLTIGCLVFDELVHASAALRYKSENDKAVLKLLDPLWLKAPDLNNEE